MTKANWMFQAPHLGGWGVELKRIEGLKLESQGLKFRGLRDQG